MIDVTTVRRVRVQRADELHAQLCAKIEQAIINAAMDSCTEVLVQLCTAMQLAPGAHPQAIRLEAYAYDIERLQISLKTAGYDVEAATYTDSFIIKW